MTSPILSENPFSDEYVIDFNDEVEDVHSTITHGSREITIPPKAKVTVPIIDTLPHLTVWSLSPSVCTSSTTSSPSQDSFSGPIQWNDADLMYLLSCLLPDLLLTSQLTFSPPLASLPSTSSPFHLCLYKSLPTTSPPPESFSKHAPIGTGRPHSHLLIAESAKCQTAQAARSSLARNILSNNGFIAYMLDKYNVLTTLYSSSTATLRSLQRGMIEMLGVSEPEWMGRYEQLVGKVDGACGLEARMEVFLLGVGMRETEEWVGVAETAIGMEEVERGVWKGVYEDAAGFLVRCMIEGDEV